MKPRDLRLLVMHVSTRCDQACAHCSVWKGNGKARGEMGLLERISVLQEASALGARTVLFTGGEPLLCDHIESLARAAKTAGLSVQLASNGLGLTRAASWLGVAVDEIYVSLEGPEAVHDSIRGPIMFARLQAAVAGLKASGARPRLVARCALSSRNARFVPETVRAARLMGFDAVSFLSIDTESSAFGGDPSARASLRPGRNDVSALLDGVATLDRAGELGGFVLEDAGKLARIANGFVQDRACAEAPPCNAPEWSSVVEANGDVRPCFFQPVVAAVQGVSLQAVRHSEAYARALFGLGRGNPVCASCVCPKHAASGLAAVRRHATGALGQMLSHLGESRRATV